MPVSRSRSRDHLDVMSRVDLHERRRMQTAVDSAAVQLARPFREQTDRDQVHVRHAMLESESADASRAADDQPRPIEILLTADCLRGRAE